MSACRLPTGRLSRQGGFTLLEILIAVVILSVGLLGLAGLQAQSLRANQSALFLSQANLLAYDVVDQMRANRDPARRGDYDISLGYDGDDVNNPGAAGEHIAEWYERIADKLPMLEDATGGSISVDSDRRVTVIVRWYDERASRDPDNAVREVAVVSQL